MNRLFLFQLLFLAFAIPSLAGDRAENPRLFGATKVEISDPSHDDEVRPPEYLFHWTSAEGLDRMASTSKFPRLTLPPMGNTSIWLLYNEFRESPALFTWSHPFTAMGIGSGKYFERYAKFGANHEAPRLLTLKIRPDAKIRVLRDSYPATSLQHRKQLADGSFESYAGADLLLHLRMIPIISPAGEITKDLIELREWVILNADVVESFNADPRALPDSVSKELLRSLDPNAQFDRDQLFITDSRRAIPKEESLTLLSAYLDGAANISSGREKIPTLFMQPFDIDIHPKVCREVFSQ